MKWLHRIFRRPAQSEPLEPEPVTPLTPAEWDECQDYPTEVYRLSTIAQRVAP